MPELTELSSLFGVGRGLSHAYVLAGGTAEERQELADYLSARYVCRSEAPPCRDCRACRKAQAHIHPDIITVAPEDGKNGISVEQARALRADAYIRPNESQRKVYIISDAQKLGDPAQNALLKVLEEGPPYAAFLLLAENPSALLPTILSRCELVRVRSAPGAVDPVPQKAREEAPILAEKLLSGDEWALLEYSVPLEKWKREELAALLDETVAVLCARVGRENAAAVLPIIESLKTVRSAAEFNVGSGHLLGYLAGLQATNHTNRRT